MDRKKQIGDLRNMTILTEENRFAISSTQTEEKDGVHHFKFEIKAEEAHAPKPITLRWKMPYFNMQGVWKNTKDHDKRQQYDWELDHFTSRVSTNSPVISVFGYDDSNGVTFACSDAINKIEMNALMREEDNHLYCHLTFFSEAHQAITDYSADLRIDTRRIHFGEALKAVGKWWEGYEATKPSPVPAIAKAPLYSSWYNFHQDLDEATLLQELKIAESVGYKLVILDDGWQTMDDNRGYDYTGDWEPDRFPDLPGFVQQVHDLGMQFGLWFSVPFCGKHSKAYKRFKGKFLTENHRWAPVFDPRYPEVREYLIGTYVNALRTYKLDAFKLDFIDDFKVYPETILTKEDGRDYANVNEAVDRLLTDVMNALRAIKSDIAIEFRQLYIGPAMRKFGNMFRAFDCPNDPVTNRIRIADLKLLSGDTAVHSDPQTWHEEERVELAALQIINGIFGVPQMSVHLRSIPADHANMIRFYTKYWNEHAHILLDGHFTPSKPLANYPLCQAHQAGHEIMAVYEDLVVELTTADTIDVLNGKLTNSLYLKQSNGTTKYNLTIWNCEGAQERNDIISLDGKVSEIEVKGAGMIRLGKVK